jgi:hypothetical protein
MHTTATNIPGAHYFTIAIASFFKFIAHSTTTAPFDGPQRPGERQQQRRRTGRLWPWWLRKNQGYELVRLGLLVPPDYRLPSGGGWSMNVGGYTIPSLSVGDDLELLIHQHPCRGNLEVVAMGMA